MTDATARVHAGLGGAVLSLTARAQQPVRPVIGYFGNFIPSNTSNSLAAFLKGLSETGYNEGQNVSIEYYWMEGHADRLPALARDLVSRRVSVIVATDNPITMAPKAATTTIPIVFRVGIDPVAAGIVASFNRPGANVTGIYNFNQDLGPKRLELLREFLPTGASVAVLFNPNSAPLAAEAKQVQSAAQILGLRPIMLNASNRSELDAAFASIAEQDVRGLLVVNSPIYFVERAHLAALAARTGLPTIFNDRLFAEAGGLMSYGTDIPAQFRQVGVYTGRVLRGEKPVDLPVQQSTKFEFILNLKTAKALGLTIPNTLLATADQVIE